MITTKIYISDIGSDIKTEIYQDTGASTKRTIDNSLNNGRLVLSKTEVQFPLARFSKIQVEFADDVEENADETEDYVILGDIPTLEAKGNNKRWKHDISLIESTKWHERLWVDTKAFSRNRDGSAIYTLYDVIIILRDIARFEREDVFLTADKVLTISASQQALLERFDAPALFFDGVTLREAINGTLSYIDATYELQNDLSIIIRFYNEITGEITEVGDFDDEMRLVTADYYSTEMDLLVNNIVNDKVILPPATPSIVHRHHINAFANNQNSQADGSPGIGSSVGMYFRSEDVVIGDSNQIIKLKENLRIYEIDDVFIGVRDAATGGVFTAQMTDYVKTEAEYSVLENYGKLVQLPQEPVKQNCVIYSIGGNNIKGFGTGWGLWNLRRTIDTLIGTLAATGTFNSGNEAIALRYVNDDNYSNDEILITVIYSPIIPKMRIKASRTNTSDVNLYSGIRENQDELLVSLQNYGSNAIAKANRIGNEEWIATETVKTLDKIKKRGFAFNGYIVTQVEKVIWPTFLKLKYSLVKGFNKLNEFVGLAGRRRQYQLNPTQTVDRVLNYTEYLRLFPFATPDSNDTVFSNEAIGSIMDALLGTIGNETVRGVILQSDEFILNPSKLENYKAGYDAGIYLPVFKAGAAKSLLFNFSLEDNLSAGDRVFSDDDIRAKTAVPYTDLNGALRKVRIQFINYLNPKWTLDDLGVTVDFDRFKGDAKNEPAVILENINLGGNLKVYADGEYRLEKDLAEKVSFTQQLQFLGYEDIIIVGNEWARLCNLILDLPGPALYFYVDDEYYGLLEDKKLKNTATQIGGITDYASIVNAKTLVLNSAGIAAANLKKAWAIGDNDGNIWVVVNQRDFNNHVTIVSGVPQNKKPDIKLTL